MAFDTFVNQITAAGLQAMHLTLFLIGAYLVWRHETSQRSATVVAQVR